ncbi:MAG: GNAT family N-acetyltransferase [Casimicrobiaceae bacterium]
MTELVVKPLSPALAGDFLRFFDHERGPAFADNPEWAKCYCHYYQVPPAIDWPSLSAPQNRTAMQARIEVGEMEGFLAYDAAEPVGWLNAQPRHKLRHCFDRMRVPPPALPCAPYQAAVIVCFVIAPAWRRRGVARTLLAAALSSLAARGLVLVDAFPFKSADSENAADHYHGALPMFTAAGFAPVAETETITVVRKFLR